MSFFGFGQSADIEIELDGADTRKLVEIKQEDGRKDRYYLYYDGETVSGKVNLSLKKSGSRLEHQGIKIEFVGQIELYYDRGNHHEFTSLVKELARPGELIHNTSYDFEFNQVEKPYESYTGTNVRLRYFLRVTVVRRISDIVRELELVVHTLSSYPDSNNSIKMEVGIEDCLHIEFEYNKSKYHLKDVIVGKIYFLLVRIKIKHMEIAIMKRETTGSGPNTFNENETIAKYEIMDGAPVRGESIPIRVFLAGYDLTPSMRDINKKFSVRYYLNLVLVDEEERRYFKQQEITLWRKGERMRRPLQEQLLAQQQAMQQLHLTGHHANVLHSAEQRAHQQQQQQQQQQPGEGAPPLGAEPPSPHQSQSPMQEEIPPVPNSVPTSVPIFQQQSSATTTPSPQPQQRLATEDGITTNQTNGTAVAATISTNNNIADANSSSAAVAAFGDPASSALKSNSVVASTKPPALPTATPTSTAAAPVTPLAGPSTPPPLPETSTTPPPIDEVEAEANGGASSPVVNSAADRSADDITAPEPDNVDYTLTNKQEASAADIPPLVGSSEPPELPSPPSDPLESPEEEFVEASAASPSPRPPREKEPLAVAQ